MNVGALLKLQLARFRVAMLRGTRLPTYLGLLVTLLVLSIFTSNERVIRATLQRLDNVVYDQRFNILTGTQRAGTQKIVIVDYDERSLAAEGQWPWSRFKLADLVTKLADLGVLVVGFDVFFPENDRNLAVELGQRVEEDPDMAAQVGTLMSQLDTDILRNALDADRAFANSMAVTDVVLGFSFLSNDERRSGVLPQPLFSMEPEMAVRLDLAEQQGYIGNVDVLQSAASGAGFFDTVPDVDGVIRRSPLFMRFRDQLYPALALEMARLYYFEDDFTLEPDRDAAGAINGLRGIKMGQILIPTDDQGRVAVPYIGPLRSYPYISATDILRGTLSDTQKELLFNSLVLVGTTSVGLYDLRATPVGAVYPGVEVHANMLNAILNSSPEIVIDGNAVEDTGESTMSAIQAELRKAQLNPFPSRPGWEEGAVIAAIVVIGLVLSLVYPHLGPALLATSSLTFLLGLTMLNFHLWNRYNLDISLVILLLLIILIATVNMTYGFLREGLNKKVIKNMFDQYVPPAHIDAMLNDPEKYNFAGESKELSVLFSDIRNFTTISEKLTAVELKSMLNEFFTPITGIIFEHNGTIDKYVGDMVMAFWGAPLDDAEHRMHAVQAALKMLAKVEELKPLFREKGLPEVNIGVGINSGMMSVGDMGSTYRRSYTVLGDAVNLGSRLEGITKAYGVKLLIGEHTYAGLTGILCRQVDKVQVKGKEEPICIYQPLCTFDEASDALKALVEEYHRAYGHYLKQQWDAAEQLFRRLQQVDPDTQLYAIYLQRIATLRKQALPQNWDGTYRHTSK
ncbi:MAG TPA: adenylate/guanylate cyclase domain-containing protein [Pseudomonadales bacterium]